MRLVVDSNWIDDFSYRMPIKAVTEKVDADVLYPPIGRGPEEIAFDPEDRTPPPDGVPLDLESPVHPDYAERPL